MEDLLIDQKTADDFLDLSEIRIGLDSLSKAKWVKLGKSAEYLSIGFPFDGNDLLHVVICKALEGKRRCRRDLAIEVFIYGAMESLIDAHLKKRKADPLQQTMNSFDDEDKFDAMVLLQSIDTPEAEIIANETLETIKKLFATEEKLLKILSLQMDDFTPAEIQNKLSLTPVQYASALKAIRRKYEKLEVK